MKRSDRNNLTVYFDVKRRQLRLGAGGTACVIGLITAAAFVAVFFIWRRF